MKIKNIVFSGVMGAILATAANAAPTIASKAYVDGLLDDNVTNLTQIIEEDFEVLSGDIADNAAAIEDNATAIAGVDAAYQEADTQIRTDFAAADAQTLSSAKGYTDQEITKLNDSLANTGTNVGALSGKLDSLTERVSTNEAGIATNKTDITNLTQTVADNKAAAEQAVADLTNGAVTTNASNIAKNATAISDLTTTVTNNATAAQQAVDNLANGAVKTNTLAIETLNGSGEGSVAKKIADAISASEATASNTYATKTYVDDKDSALDTRVKANEEYIAKHKTDYDTLTQTVADNKTAAENAVKALADNAVKANTDAIGAVASLNTTEKTNTVDAINEVNANVTTLMANAETAGSVDNKVQAYAIPKPDLNQCNAVSGLCVLSYNSQGVLQWVDVTEEGTTTPDEPADSGQEA